MVSQDFEAGYEEGSDDGKALLAWEVYTEFAHLVADTKPDGMYAPQHFRQWQTMARHIAARVQDVTGSNMDEFLRIARMTGDE